MKKTGITALILLAVSLACAHEFWLQPSTFILKKDQIAVIDLMAGEDYSGSPVTLSKQRIAQLSHFFRDQQRDPGKRYAHDSITSIRAKLTTSGGHLFAFNSTNRFIEIEAGKFNDYLRDEGLDHILEWRAVNGDTIKPGREMYQRCVKTLLQVDDIFDQTYASRTGMRLEIIPYANPYEINKVSDVTFQVQFDHRPLRNRLVLCWHTVNGKTTHSAQRTNSKGEVTFAINRSGAWMISVVEMVSFEDKTIADWQSFWGSYTFGY